MEVITWHKPGGSVTDAVAIAAAIVVLTASRLMVMVVVVAWMILMT